jgi:hypothetical protein
VRVGATFYRDRDDDVRVAQIPFTADVAGFAATMQTVVASGGGDYAEDMYAGLEAALSRMAWTEETAVRVLVIVADAPPHTNTNASRRAHDAVTAAWRRGIRLLPAAASGANRAVEYLFRAMGAATSTPYVYLTDDSGVGSPHLAADTDGAVVERLGDLLTRLVIADLRGEGMHAPASLAGAARNTVAQPP